MGATTRSNHHHGRSGSHEKRFASRSLVVLGAGLTLTLSLVALPTTAYAATPPQITQTTITVGNYPYGVAVSPTGPEAGDIYVTNYGSSTVSVISPSTNKVIDTITVGSGPHGVAVSPITGDIYVANSFFNNTVSVISPSTNKVIDTIGVEDLPYGVAVSPITGDIYVANTGSDDVSVIDPTTNKVVDTITVGSEPRGVAVSPATGDIYVANYFIHTVSVIDPSTNTVTATITVGNYPYGVAVSPTGPAAGDIYVTNYGSSTVSVIDPSTNKVIDTITVGSGPHGVAVSPITGDIYVANNFLNNTVSVIDPSTNKVIDTITVDSEPRGVAVSPATGDIYVANTDSNNVSVLVYAPVITSISPTSGPVAGGTTVTITGTGLSNASAVDFGPGNPGTIVKGDDTATSITVTDPSHTAGTVDVTVKTPGGTSNGESFTYAPVPKITSISPTSGPVAGGTTVTITGTGLSNASAVDFGTKAGTIISDNATSMTVKDPSGVVDPVNVTVTTPGGTSNTEPFTYTVSTPITTPPTPKPVRLITGPPTAPVEESPLTPIGIAVAGIGVGGLTVVALLRRRVEKHHRATG